MWFRHCVEYLQLVVFICLSLLLDFWERRSEKLLFWWWNASVWTACDGLVCLVKFGILSHNMFVKTITKSFQLCVTLLFAFFSWLHEVIVHKFQPFHSYSLSQNSFHSQISFISDPTILVFIVHLLWIIISKANHRLLYTCILFSGTLMHSDCQSLSDEYS